MRAFKICMMLICVELYSFIDNKWPLLNFKSTLDKVKRKGGLALCLLHCSAGVD